MIYRVVIILYMNITLNRRGKSIPILKGIKGIFFHEETIPTVTNTPKIRIWAEM